MSASASDAPPREVAEERLPGEVPLWRHPEWARRFPRLVQGTTGAGEGDEAFDLGLFGTQPVGAALGRWRRLREATGLPVAVHSLQVHGAEIQEHEALPPAGLVVAEGHDGHITGLAGVLLTVSVADCVPVSVVDPAGGRLALVHAGWRGVAAGIVRRAVSALAAHAGSGAGLWMHAGPSICGACYEVGPEVHRAVYPGEVPPAGPVPIDLRGAIARQALECGVPEGQVSVSAHCTRCGPGAFFSHRAGSPARQMGVLGRQA